MDEYMMSWTRHNPGFLVQRWDERNTPMTPFVASAINRKLYSAASNYVRFAVLKRWGGIYLDTDVEVVRPFDPLLSLEFFLGFQYEPEGTPYKPEELIVNGAVMGSRPGHAFAANMLRRFPAHVDELDPQKAPHGPSMLTDALRERGLQGYSSEAVMLGDVTVLRKETFYPYFWGETFSPELVTESTIAIHHWAKSW